MKDKPRVQTNADGTYRLDSWQNAASGMGISGIDKSMYGAFSYYSSQIDRSKLSKMYRYDWLARKICERPAHDAVKRWINLDDESTKSELERLGAKKKLRTAIAWARLYGGAAGLLIVDDGMTSADPLDPSKVTKVVDIKVVDRHYLQPVGKIEDVHSVSFGEPEYYTTNNGKVFHRSRVLKFTGADLTQDEQESELFWGGSFVELYIDAVKQFQESMQDARHIMTESSVGILKIPNLTNSVKVGGTVFSVIQARLDQFNLSKSVYRTAAIDSEEEFDFKARQLSGLSNILDVFMTQVSGATDMTQLVLFGTTPGGLNASQKEQFEVYYDMVRGSIQEDDLMLALNTLIACINKGKIVKWDYVPLSEPDDMEVAEIRAKEAESIAKISDSLMLAPEDVAAHLNKTGYFDLPESGFLELDDDEVDSDNESTSQT